MKRKLVLLLVLLGLVGLALGVVKLIGTSTPKQGVLKINTNPVTSVFLDNKHLGKTPYQDKINEGNYEIKLVPESVTENAASWQGKITIRGNLLTYVNTELGESEFSSASEILWLEKITSNQSEISVVTDPDGASITLDGESKGISPIAVTGISAGEHVIAVASPGFASRSIKAKTTEGYKLFISMKLALSSSQSIVTMETPEATQSASPSATLQTKPATKSTPTPSLKVSPTLGVTQEPLKPFALIKDTPTGFLRVRFEPSTQASETARVNPGEKYTILDTENGWYQITLDDGTKGWISGQYATKVE